MQKRILNCGGALFIAGVLALAGCSGKDGAQGAPGTPGQDLTATAKPESCAVCHGGAGASHQAVYNQYKDASQLQVTIDGVSSVLNADKTTFTSTMTFTVKLNGQPWTAGIAALDQKRYAATTYDSATRKFNASFDYGTPTASATPGQYTVTNTTASFAPESTNAQVYVYAAEGKLVSEGMQLYSDVSNVGQEFGDVETYVSAANVSGCEKCHGTPYMKHGYRAAAVAGLPDFAACKACHYDTRNGGHQAWQLLVDDPAAYAAQNGTPTAEQNTKFAYKASVMNDTHMSHAMEFAYPQTMANCVTCHEGKLAAIFADANFTLATCKSCHPVTAVGGADPKRAPALKDVVPHTTFDLYTYAGNCGGCHSAGGGAPTFGQVHSGRNNRIYAADGTKYSSTITTTVDSASFDSATNVLTVNFSVSGAAATAIVKPTVVISLYGYDTKDFLVGGHASQPAPDGKRNLEWSEGASGNSPRLTVTPATATAGNTAWVATADLTLWAGRLADGSVKKAEIGILPALGIDQTVAPQNSATNQDGTPRTDYNPYIAIAGATKTFDLVGKAVVPDADVYGKAIVDPAKCNKCHEALGTTFHSPAYGGSGVVACRLCHVVGSGGSHLEMQSRSIDSYVHAIHSFQAFDIGDVDFGDPVASLRYNHHVESTYPNFTILNCESCHNAGTYEVPDQSKSLASILSGADTLTNRDRAIGAVPSYVTGPASRACGSCHRAEMITEDNAGALAAFNEHTSTFGYLLDASQDASSVLQAAIDKIMAVFK